MSAPHTRTWWVFGSLSDYQRGWLRPDIIAGLTVWAVLVPEALAYATIAGVPPVVGLYAAVPSLILYAAAGSSRHLIVGPMSATAALSAAMIAPLASGDDARFIALSAAGDRDRTRRTARRIHAPRIHRILHLRAGSQGIHRRSGAHDHHRSSTQTPGRGKGGGNFFVQTWTVVKELGEVDLPTVIIGLLSLAMVLGVKRWLPLVPGSLLVVLLGITAVALFGLDDRGIDIVGHIDSGLPSMGLPSGVGAEDYLDLVGPAVGVLLIGFAEGLGAAKTYAAKAGYTIDANRELAGLGAANLDRALLGNGGQRQPVEDRRQRRSGRQISGQRTGGRGADAGDTAVSHRPVREVARGDALGVVIAAVIELLDFSSLAALYRVWTKRLGSIYGHAARAHFAAAIAAMFGVLLFDTLPGLIIGIAVRFCCSCIESPTRTWPLWPRTARVGSTPAAILI